jgi:tRNA 5-methylaminomethyl-2-thiouridine biosynthesis bifunctional protein
MATKQNNPYSIPSAKPVWGDNGPASSEMHGPQEGELDKCRHVFLSHNRLAERWSALDRETAGRFTIIETGFGTGLNFLLAWQLWQQTAPPNWQLHYVSIEERPCSAEQLRRVHASWPELASLAAILQHNYPPLLLGHHRRLLNSAQVCLDLLFGNAHDCLPALLDAPSSAANDKLNSVAYADAWFLNDAPLANNEAKPQETLFASMAALSKPGSSFAAAADFWEPGLRAQGFSLEKMTVYDGAQQILWGHLPHDIASSTPQPTPVNVPWHLPGPKQQAKHIVVIGAGLAGCSTANALAQRGYRVTVIERHTPASGASGNPQGILYTKLSAAPGDLNQFNLGSFLFALNHYRSLLSQGRIDGELCGVLQLVKSEREIKQFNKLKVLLNNQDWLQFLSDDELYAKSGVSLSGQAFYYPDAGWLSPPSVCHAMLNHPNITLLNNTAALALTHHEGVWQLLDDQQHCIQQADTVVIANSNDASHFAQTSSLPLKSIRGQLSYLPAEALNQSPTCVICHEGYLAPAMNEQFCIGASFDLHNKDCALMPADHDWNLKQLSHLAAGLLKPDAVAIGGRAALRCASTDYMPIVGAVPRIEEFKTNYKGLTKDARRKIPIAAANHPNLYINVAHGSRGLTSTPLCAELLASYIANEVRPLPRQLCEALSPARFIIRKLIRSQLV